MSVCRADPVGIKRFLWDFDELSRLTPSDKVLVVANRVKASEQREVGEILRRHTGRKPIAYIPDRAADLDKALRSGSPVRTLHPSSEFASCIRLVAAALGASVAARGFLARLGGRV